MNPARTVPALAPVAPTAGLILSLDVRTMLPQSRSAHTFGAVMLTYPAPRFGDIDPAAIETQMLSVASALGALPYTLKTGMPTVGARITMHERDAAIWFAGCTYGLRIMEPAWATAAVNLGAVLLMVGLDELSSAASRAEVDEYRVHAMTSGRMLVANARIDSFAVAQASVLDGGTP